jgi:hypothetical protein
MIHFLFLLFICVVSQVQEIELERVLTLGAIDGKEQWVFGRIADVELDESGTVYVLDAMAGEVRVFGLDGEHLRTFGRKGDGPGEFRSPRALDQVDGTIVVTDVRRVTQFSPSGDLLGDLTVSVPGVVRVLPLQDPGFVLLREGVVNLSRIDGNQVVRMLRRGEWSEILAGSSSGIFYRGSDQAMALKSPLCSSLYLAPLVGGGFLVAHGGEGFVRRFSQDGVAVADMRVTGKAPPLAGEREKEFFGLVQKRVENATRERVVMPAYESTICGLEVEGRERAWVQLSTDGRRVWQALDLETGRTGESFVLPPDEKAVAFRNGRIAAIGRDELDVEYVYLYGIPGSGK